VNSHPYTVQLSNISANQPTFSGKPEEDVEIFARQRKYNWAGRVMTEEKNEAVARTMLSGLWEVAAKFTLTLPWVKKIDSRALLDALRKRYHEME
jgi:hypothetical protein